MPAEKGEQRESSVTSGRKQQKPNPKKKNQTKPKEKKKPPKS